MDITTPLAVTEPLVACNDTTRGWLVVRGDPKWEAAPAYEGPAIDCPLRDVIIDSLRLRGTRSTGLALPVSPGGWIGGQWID